MTIQEVADKLCISYFAARQRIVRAGIKPITKEALYPDNTYDLVKNSPGKGRPKVKPETLVSASKKVKK